MQEKAITLKGAARLAAIVTLPDMQNRDLNASAVLILNEGILHRIGTSRLHVKVARRLAALGLICLRMDHSSIGDSGPRRGTQSFEEAGVAEVQTAMDYLTSTYGTRKFIIFGLCSGSDVAFEVGVIDDRVSGLIQLDAHIFETTRSRINQLIHHYGPRLFKLSVWINSISIRIDELISGRKKSVTDVLDEEGRDEWYADPDYIRIRPAIEDVEKGLNTIVSKKIPMYLCFTHGGYYGDYNYVDQHREAFSSIDFGDLLEVQWIVGCTHLFTALSHQDQLLGEIEQWLSKYELLPGSQAQDAA